ncbi:methyltransferase domain-containing protein [Aliifodinibius sp. S!AR15-10]|uniref:methyltransferase domain-containing protein n=1 Tax=Aliifodinibius sp. S!AR15-10 TaxID=2950437 RepID=UPI00285D75E5|nr:methyltransferase domain-containing protein [Aliifodinibius sp. S!AR15-10]MDR8394111.1 methyltransferase domain-containing protein [Aliifodinibius sp. S!AR15-10]
MPLFLTERATDIRERMDDPDCDRKELFNTYRQFSVINALISQWGSVYKQYIRPFALANERTCSILDIGFGGGDIPIKLAQWCREDGITPVITAIETDKRAFEFIQDVKCPDCVSFRLASSTEMVQQSRKFDFVISNHLLHHLEDVTFYSLLEEAESLSSHYVLFNDIERSDVGYLLFNLLSRPIFRSSFITEDGLTSIKRSYTRRELQRKVPDGWQVTPIFPYRLLLTFRHE